MDFSIAVFIISGKVKTVGGQTWSCFNSERRVYHEKGYLVVNYYVFYRWLQCRMVQTRHHL